MTIVRQQQQEPKSFIDQMFDLSPGVIESSSPAAPVTAGTSLIRKKDESFDALRTIGVFAGGFNQPIIDVLDILGIADQDGKLADILDTNLEPRNQWERDARTAGDFIKSNMPALIPQFMAAKTLQLGSNLILQGASTATLVRESLAKLIQSNPGMTFAVEQLSAVTSGIGVSEAKDAGGGPLIQATAGAVTGLAPGVVLSKVPKTTFGIGKAIYNTVANEEALAERIRGAIGIFIKRGLDETAEKNLIASNQLFKDLDVENPLTLPEATGTPSLLALQRHAERNAEGAQLNVFVSRKEEAFDAILNTPKRPDMIGREPEIIIDLAAQRIKTDQKGIRAAAKSVTEREENLGATLPKSDRVAAGDTLRARQASKRKVVRDEFTQRATDIGLNNSEVQFPFIAFREIVTQEFFTKGSVFATGRKPEILKKLHRHPEPAKGKKDLITFEDLQAIRTTIGDELSESAANGQKDKVRQLTKLRAEFDTYFNNIDPVPIASNPDIGKQWTAFRNDYFETFIKRFDRGTSYKIRQLNRRGEYVTQPELVADAFLKSESTAQDFKRLFGNDLESNMALVGAVYDKARKAAVVDGVVNVKKLNDFVRSSRWLDEFPSIKLQLENKSAAQRALSGREAQLNKRSLVVDRAGLNNNVGGDAKELIRRGVRNENTAKFLLRTARQNKREDVLVASVWEEAYKQLGISESTLPDPVALERWMLANEGNLKIMIGAEHFKNIRNVYKALSLVRQTDVPLGKAPPTGPLEHLEDLTGTGIPQISSRIFAAESGRVSYRYNAIDAAARLLNRLSKRRQNAVLFEVLTNKGLARDLAMAQRMQRVTPQMEKRMRSWLFGMGMVGVEGSTFEAISAPGFEDSPNLVERTP